jgi:hypothetical protein
MFTERLLGATLIGVAVPPEDTVTEWVCAPSEVDPVEGTSMLCV